MSISSEITSIGENLKKDYQSIANLGADLTGVDKNIENIAELLDGVYDNYPKTSFQTGTEVTLENCNKGKLDFEDGKVGIGQAEQDSTQGYNLFNPTEVFNNLNGITSTITNQIMKWNGTASANGAGKVANANIPSGTITISLITVSGTHTSGKRIWVDLYNGSTKVGNTSFTQDGNKQVTVSSNVNIINMGFDSGDVFNNYTFKLQIESGTTAHEWEQYTGGYLSPSPNWKQEIKYVRGKNIFTFSTKTEDGWYTDIPNCIKNIGTYTLSINNSSLSGNWAVYFINSNKERIGDFIKSSSAVSTPSTFVVTQEQVNAPYIRILPNASGLHDLDNYKIQIEEGSATPYLPYNTIEEVVRGKNLFIPTLTNNGTSITRTNCTITLNGDEFVFVATGSDMYLGNVKGEGSTYTNDRGIKIYRNGNSKISYKSSNSALYRTFITAFDKNGVSLGYTEISVSYGTYTFPENCDFVTFRFGTAVAVSGTTYKTKFMVAYGDTIPDYEPYKTPKTYQFNLGNNKFYGIDTYKDYILRTTGKNKCNITSAKGYVYSAGLPLATEDPRMIIDSFDSNKITYHSNDSAYLEVLTNQIQLKPNTKYTITFKRTSTATNNQFFIYNYVSGTGYSINYRDNNTNVYETTFTTSDNGIIALAFGFGQATGSATISNIQIEEGSTASDYQPFGVGNWYKYENIEEVILTGGETETWTKSSNTGIDRFVNSVTRTSMSVFTALSNYFENTSSGAYRVGFWVDSSTNEFRGRIIIDFSAYGTTTLEQFKTWLSTHNTKICLIRGVPILTQITGELATQLEAFWNAQSVEDTTIIEGDGDLPMLINVRALKGGE